MLPRLVLLCLCAVLCSGEPLQLTPAFVRLDLPPQAVQETVLQLRAQPGTMVTAVIADCACLRTLTTLPIQIAADGTAAIRMRVTGMRPGVEDILVATSAGIVRAQIQIVGPGAGRGADQLRAALDEATAHSWQVLGIAHDLHGQVRHCGCSQGALGGTGRLARLPALAAELKPGMQMRWVLSGDSDGKRTGVGAALAEHGWSLGDPGVRVSADPLSLLGATGIIAIIPTTSVAVEHRRLVRPVLTDGMAIELLLVDAAGAIQARRTMPIDESLPDDPDFAARFRDALTSRIDASARPAQACAGCHATAFAAWQRTRHASALDSLPAADRTDTCIGCHTTPLAPAVLAPAVSCQSCHGGSDAHAASGGSLRTTGTIDCRSCHDARHHPAFRREAAWPRIEHGREGAAP
jgi:hypothetical protein